MDVVFSEDNAYIVIMTGMILQIYDLEEGEFIYEMEFEQRVLYAEFILNDEFLVIGTGNIESERICHFNCGSQASDKVQTIYTCDLSNFEWVNQIDLHDGRCIYGITEDDRYICMESSENYVTSYSCLTDEVLYDFVPELFQNVDFYPFDQNQVAYKLEDDTLVLYNFVEDVEITRIPCYSNFQSRTFYYNIPNTDRYIGFESVEILTSRLFIYDISEQLKYYSTSSYEHRAGRSMLYYLQDRVIFLYGDSYGWNAEIYYYP